jgi:hypothetical protein
MNKIITKVSILECLYFFLSLIPGIILFVVLRSNFYPIHLASQSIFFFDLLGFPVYVTTELLCLSGFASLVFIWIISKKIFAGISGYLPVIIFSSSPWFIYSLVFGSFYIFLMSIILINIISLIYLNSKKQKFFVFLFFITFALIIYSSFLMLLIYPFSVAALIFINKEIRQKLVTKSTLIIFAFIFLSFVPFIFTNPTCFKDLYKTQVMFLTDPGYINAINQFRGESARKGIVVISTMFENKLIYTTEYLIFKFVSNLSPAIYFAPNTKLLGFSFSPPLYFGFLLPFLYGLYLIIKASSLRRYLFLLFFFTLPSFFSQKYVDLNRLLIFAPVVVFIISYGLSKIPFVGKGKLVIIIIITMVLLQYFVNISDILTREYTRYQRIYGIEKTEIDKQ